MGAPDGHTAHAAAQQLIEDGFLDVHAVFGLVEDDARFRIDNSIRHFLAAMRGETVHEERVRRGFRHECFVDLVGRKFCSAGFLLVFPSHAGPLVGVDGVGSGDAGVRVG